MVQQPPVKKHVLDNGLTILHQRNPVSRAFCIGVWTRSGARDERPGEEGLCHFLEHMLFKGTRRRTAYDLSLEIERVGGSLDAFTTKDTMCLYTHTLESQCGLAFDLLSDMLRGSTFADDLVAVERNVVMEEIGDVEDAPDDLIHELFAAAVFPDHPMGRPILGTRESVASFDRADLRRFSRRGCRGGNVVVSVYGNITTRELVSRCRDAFTFAQGRPRLADVSHRNGTPVRRATQRKLSQQHVCIGVPTFSFHDENRYALMVLTTLLGGGMSSRLFQRIREERGLTYNIYTYADHSRDSGIVATYMAVKPANAAQAVSHVMHEYDLIRRDGVPAAELDDTKEHLKGRILLGLETSTARMMNMARSEINYGRQIGERELLRRINAVSMDDLMKVASEVLTTDQSMVSLGPGRLG